MATWQPNTRHHHTLQPHLKKKNRPNSTKTKLFGQPLLFKLRGLLFFAVRPNALFYFYFGHQSNTGEEKCDPSFAGSLVLLVA